MSRGAHIDYHRTTGRLRAAIDDALARLHDAKPQSSRRHALGSTRQAPPGVVDLPGPLHVRVVRVVPHPGRIDDDNLQGGCKQLRDALAEFLGRKGDSARAGLTWEVVEEQGETAIRIEIFQKVKP